MAQPHDDIEYSGENRNLCHSDTKGVYVLIQRSVETALTDLRTPFQATDSQSASFTVGGNEAAPQISYADESPVSPVREGANGSSAGKRKRARQGNGINEGTSSKPLPVCNLTLYRKRRYSSKFD